MTFLTFNTCHHKSGCQKHSISCITYAHKMLLAIWVFVCLVRSITANTRCMKYCASDNHFYDGTVAQTIQHKTERYCRKLALCEGFNYDSAAAACHFINSTHNLTPAAGSTAWSMKVCAGMYYAVVKPGPFTSSIYTF